MLTHTPRWSTGRPRLFNRDLTALSCSGGRVATATRRGPVRVQGEGLDFELELGPVTQLAMSSELLFVGLKSGLIARVELKTHSTVQVHAHRGAVTALSCVGDVVVSGGEDTLVRVWTSALTPAHTMDGHSSWVQGCALSGDVVASACRKDVILWKVIDGTTTRLFGHDRVNAVRFVDPDRLLTAGDDGTIKLWRVSDGSVLQNFKAHRGAVNDVVVVGERVVSAGVDRVLRCWSLEGAQVGAWRGHLGEVLQLASSDAQLVSCARDRSVRSWSLDELEHAADPPGHDARIRTLRALPDGSLLSAGDDYVIHRWDAASGVKLVSYRGLNGSVRAIAGDERAVVAGDSNGEVCIWEPDGGQRARFMAHDGPAVRCALFEGRIFTAGRDSPVIKVFDMHGGQVGELEGHTERVHAMNLSGGVLLSGAGDGWLLAWDLSTMQVDASLHASEHTLKACIQGVDGWVAGDDEGCLVFARADGSALRVQAHDGPVAGLAAHGRVIVSSGLDGWIRLWSEGVLVSEHDLEVRLGPVLAVGGQLIVADRFGGLSFLPELLVGVGLD